MQLTWKSEVRYYTYMSGTRSRDPVAGMTIDVRTQIGEDCPLEWLHLAGSLEVVHRYKGFLEV